MDNIRWAVSSPFVESYLLFKIIQGKPYIDIVSFVFAEGPTVFLLSPMIFGGCLLDENRIF